MGLGSIEFRVEGLGLQGYDENPLGALALLLLLNIVAYRLQTLSLAKPSAASIQLAHTLSHPKELNRLNINHASVA